MTLVALLASCSGEPNLESVEGEAQGTTWRVSYWAPAPPDSSVVRARLTAELDRIDQLLSNYRADSAIERFNAAITTDPVAVGPEIVQLVSLAREVGNASNGCYDLTIQPLVELWGFTGDQLSRPDPAALTEAMARVGLERIDILAPDRLRKSIQDIRLDVSSIAQGYTVGRLAAELENLGLDDYLVEIGGELQTRGRKPDGQPWRIGIERPVPGARAMQKTLVIERDAPIAVLSSGTYRHYFNADGVRYSHIIDSRNGRPVSHDTVSVTVIDENPAWADAWTTALLCLGEAAGQSLADTAHIAALFIAVENGRLKETASQAWQAMSDIEVVSPKRW